MNKEYSVELVKEIDAVLEDDEFVEIIKNTKDSVEIQNAFKNKGIDIDDEVALIVFDKISHLNETGEFDEETLEAVSGGTIMGAIVFFGAARLSMHIVYQIGKRFV